jgi:hypothetical protein
MTRKENMRGKVKINKMNHKIIVSNNTEYFSLIFIEYGLHFGIT